MNKQHQLLNEYKSFVMMSENEKEQFWAKSEHDAALRSETEKVAWQEAITDNLIELKAKLVSIQERITEKKTTEYSS